MKKLLMLQVQGNLVHAEFDGRLTTTKPEKGSRQIYQIRIVGSEKEKLGTSSPPKTISGIYVARLNPKFEGYKPMTHQERIAARAALFAG